MKARWKKHILNFKRPSGTSRGILYEKPSWYLIIEEADRFGIGEVSIIPGLSPDNIDNIEAVLDDICKRLTQGEHISLEQFDDFPAINFGLETALTSFRSETSFNLFPSKFTSGEDHISINGLIWMGDVDFMTEQIRSKIEEGFKCIKMKVGAIDFDQEVKILKRIRSLYSAEEIVLRVDANGAFSPSEAMEKLKILSDLDLHSIEQPIKQGQFKQMAHLCQNTPLPIALDEELIGVKDRKKRDELLNTINPHYIILKPSLLGGLTDSAEWIELAESSGIGWWVTSALEGNIGLNAIAQWTYNLNSELPQGLGTGSLFTNNIDSPLIVKNGTLQYQSEIDWDLKYINE